MCMILVQPSAFVQRLPVSRADAGDSNFFEPSSPFTSHLPINSPSDSDSRYWCPSVHVATHLLVDAFVKHLKKCSLGCLSDSSSKIGA